MNTLEALRTELIASTSVTDLVSERIYALVRPQPSDLPAVVMTVVTDTPESSMTGTSADLLRNARVQVDCYAETYDAAHELAAAVDGVLSALSRADLSTTRDMLRDEFEAEAGRTGVFRVSMDFSVWR